MANESLKKTLGIAILISLVCAILVSSAVVILKKIEVKNRQQEMMLQILRAGKMEVKGRKINTLFQERVKPAMILLSTGEVVSGSSIKGLPDLKKFNIKKISRHAQLSLPLPANQDRAGIKRIPKYMVIYYIQTLEQETYIILPIHGRGLWSTMYGYLALAAKDIRRITGITFYEHGETPGMGGEIDNPKWQQSWQGKLALDSRGKVMLQVKKGRATIDSPYEIDGLSGATITSRGVDDMIKFWLGNDKWQTGYGPFLKKLKEKQTNGKS